MVIISDSSTIIGLDNIGRLDILQYFNSEIIIPEAVYDEIQEKASNKLKNAEWIKIQECKDKDKVNELQGRYNLHKGETEAIVLALEFNADLLIIDEIKGRNVAFNLDLRIKGVAGILGDLKRKNYISEIKPFLQELDAVNFRISKKIKRIILKEAGEE